MQPRGSTAKYRTRHRAPTDDELAAHLAGTITLAGVLIGRDGLAGAGLIELDILAEEGARRALAELAARGVVAFAIATPGAGEHNGSHVWALYQERTDPRAIAHQLAGAAQAAGLPTDEVYPSGKAIRLPFGLHRWTGRRGVLLVQDGRRFDLDTPDEFAASRAAVLALPRNPVPPLPAPEPVTALAPVPALTPRQERPTSPRTGRANPSQVIARFNAEHSAEELLSRYGATRTRDGWACNCGVAHEHETQLIVTDQGRIVFFSARCRWAPSRTDRNGRPVADAFGLYALLEHGGDRTAALRAYNPIAPRQGRPAPEEAERRQSDPEARAREAARKRQARRAAVATTLQAVRDRAAQDPDLAAGPTIAAVLRELLAVAGERDWCRPSVALLAERLDCSERTVQRALSWLEGRYIATEQRTTEAGATWSGGNGTARRTFLREPLRGFGARQSADAGVTRPDAENAAVSPEYIEQVFLESALERVSAAPPPPAAEPPPAAPAPAPHPPAGRFILNLDSAVDAALACGASSLTAVRARLAAEQEQPATVAEPPPAALTRSAAEPHEPAPATTTAEEGEAPAPAELGACFAPVAAEERPAPLRRRRVRDFAPPDWHHAQLQALDALRAENGQGAPVQSPAAPEQPAAALMFPDIDALHAESRAAEEAARDAGKRYGVAKASGARQDELQRLGRACREAQKRAEELRERIGRQRERGLGLMLAATTSRPPSADDRAQGGRSPAPAAAWGQASLFTLGPPARAAPAPALCAD
jgi:hypothetical protein